MSDNTKISWSDATWNPVWGCTPVSPGCDHCYAERLINGRLAHLHPGGFNTVRLRPEQLDKPLRWKRPRLIFVNSMSDLFHDDIPDEYIAQVFAVMALAPQHTFQVLTKRHGRMRSLLSSTAFISAVREIDMGRHPVPQPAPRWPLPNVWVGVSVENQKWADIRIPALLDTPAAIRFLSCEPLLGPVHLNGPELTHLDWVIVGGESGPGARPMHPNWARSLREDCAVGGVAFHFKQWGEWAPDDYSHATHLIQELNGTCVTRKSATVKDPYGSGSGTQDLVDRGHPGWARITRKGKRFAGRLLDGETWDQYPQPVVTT